MDAFRDGTMFSDTSLYAPEVRAAAVRTERLLVLADRLLDRLEDEIESGHASELYDLSETLWNIASVAGMMEDIE